MAWEKVTCVSGLDLMFSNAAAYSSLDNNEVKTSLVLVSSSIILSSLFPSSVCDALVEGIRNATVGLIITNTRKNTARQPRKRALQLILNFTFSVSLSLSVSSLSDLWIQDSTLRQIDLGWMKCPYLPSTFTSLLLCSFSSLINLDSDFSIFPFFWRESKGKRPHLLLSLSHTHSKAAVEQSSETRAGQQSRCIVLLLDIKIE